MSEQLTPTTPQRGWGPVVLWACYLGSSWTWIIGMFMPVLLLRDYGLGGWVVFAIPNVLGAAAMGFVIASPQRSRRTVTNHAPACFRFSEITIAFHVFVVGWAYWFLFGGVGILATAAVAVAVFLTAGQRRSMLIASAIVTAISAAALLGWLTLPEALATFDWDGPRRLNGTDLLLFAPVAIVGFALCPYLDLTFHQAREATEPTTGKAAFAIGFGVVFLVMIAFSLLYASTLLPLLEDPWQMAPLPQTTLLVLGAHMTLQAGLTVGLHTRQLIDRRGHVGVHRLGVLAVAAGAIAYWALTEQTIQHRMISGELVYRGFLLFYGLVFPGYVWLCMIPTRRFVPPGARLAIYAVSVIMALPMTYLGFITGPTWWVLPALGVLVLGRIVLECIGDEQASAPSALDERER